MAVDHIDGKTGTTELDPAHYLDDATISAKSDRDTGLIILNSPLEDFEYVHRLARLASFIICADGGANRLFDLMISKFSDHAWDVAVKKCLPDAIHGDLDSIRSDVLDAYASLGVSITKDPDQYSTDFGKAVRLMLKTKHEVNNILVLGSLGGRVDQGVGLLHELYREQRHRRPNVRFWLFSEASISVVLQPGRSILQTVLSKGIIRRNIGILPVYGPAVINTKGLEWDVSDWETEMGGMLSTSNHIVADVIEIDTNHEVLFTVERCRAE